MLPEEDDLMAANLADESSIDPIAPEEDPTERRSGQPKRTAKEDEQLKKRQERIAAQLEEKGGYAALNEQLKKKENTLNERDELAKQERIKKQKALSRQRLNQNPSQFAEEPLFFA